MHPYVYGVPAFLVVLPFAVTVGLATTLAVAQRRGLAWRRLLGFLLALTLAALAGAKLFSIIERGEVGSLAQELGTGFRYPGGLLAALIAMPLLWALLAPGISLPVLLDCVAPGIGTAMAVMRMHCLLSGCCAGTVCSHAWCITYPQESPPFQHQMIDGLIAPSAPHSLAVHPLPLYFALASLAAAVVALWYARRARVAGETFLVFLVAHEGGKFLLEYFRAPAAVAVQRGSLVVAGAALAVLAVMHWRRRAAPPGATIRGEGLRAHPGEPG